MKVNLQGGFGEKGRTSILVQHNDAVLMLDAGIKVGASEADYHPKLAVAASEIDALIVSHAHEDHIGALPWLICQGFVGQIFMTEETRAEMPKALDHYALGRDRAAINLDDLKIKEFSPGDEIVVKDLTVCTGHSGHVAGGVWLHVLDPNGKGLIYSGDVVPNSSVFPMSVLPQCDLLVLDASYGADLIGMRERVQRITEWINLRPQGALLPTPLSGRSIELISIMPGPFAIAQGMRESLLSQINNAKCVEVSVSDRLEKLINAAPVWKLGAPFPKMPLLSHDGMGVGGPSVLAIEQASSFGHPILCTGHLPPGSPGEEAVKNGKSDWLRLPTHPNALENLMMWQMAGQPRVIGHSCTNEVLDGLQAHIPSLESTATGQSYSVMEAAA